MPEIETYNLWKRFGAEITGRKWVEVQAFMLIDDIIETYKEMKTKEAK